MAQPPRRARSGARQETGFEPTPSPAAGQDDAFEAPGEGGEEQKRFAAEGVDPTLEAMRYAVERILFSRGNGMLKTYAEGEALQGADNIVGVGIGPAMPDFGSVRPEAPGAPVLNVYIAEPMTMDEAKAVLVDAFGASALSSDAEPVNVIRTGLIDTHTHRHRERPARCGISVAHVKSTADTLGALARGRAGEQPVDAEQQPCSRQLQRGECRRWHAAT